MFPQSGNGFIWDHRGIVRDDRLETTIFVPESKKIFPISISTKEIKKDDITSTAWIEWTSVGERDAVKPNPVINARLMDGSKEIIQPEYENQTVFKSVLIFPDRDDLVAFVGKRNAWSPHVGIVRCSEDEEIMRGVYCTGYIEWDTHSIESSFKVKSQSLKYPEGYISKRDQKDFEEIIRKIELAMEEANILASKGKGPVEETRMIPSQVKVEDMGGFDDFNSHNDRVIKTDLNGPGWIKRKSKKEIADIEKASEFIKNNRFQYFIVYKEREKGPGFVGWTPVIGSVVITSLSHKTTDQRVKVGQTLNTRVEYNKHSCSFVVESIVEIEKKPLVPFDIQYNKQKDRTELIILCMTLDLKGFTLLPKCYNGKRVGVVEHPTLKKVLVSEADALNEKWKGKEVTAQLIHYEGIENDTPDRIRLILRYIEGLYEDTSNDSSTCVDIKCGIPDEIESDDEEDEDDEREEKEEKKLDRIESASPSNTFKQYDTKIAGRSSTNEKEEKKGGRGFNDYEGYQGETGGGFDNNYGGFGCNESGGYDGNGRRGGYGGNERGQGRGRGRGRGGSDYYRESRYGGGSSDQLPMSGHGFPHKEEQRKIHIGQGILVYYSMQSSIIYMMEHRLAEYKGDAKLCKLMLGDSVEFETEPASGTFTYNVVRGSLRRIPNLLDYKMDIQNDELFILIPGSYLTPRRDIFECKPISDIKLDPHTTMLKLSNGEFVKKTQVKIGHSYHIYVKFSVDESKWIFDCINVNVRSFELEEEDEIDREKKLLHEINRSESSMARSRNGDGGYERDSRDGSDRHSMRSEPNSQWSRIGDEREYGDNRADKYSMRSSNSIDFSRRGNEYSNDYEGRESRYTAPSRQSSKAQSVLSASTQLTSTSTTTTEKELRRELNRVKRMLNNVWGYKEIQEIVKVKNYYLFESVDDWMIKEAEDKSEQ